MKKYLVFAGEYYYPGGGWSDMIGCVNSVEEAKKLIASKTYYDWWEIVDISGKEPAIVEEGGC